MIIKYPDKIAQKIGEHDLSTLYKYNTFWPVHYIIDRRYRKSVHLVSWLKKQVEDDSFEFTEAIRTLIPKSKNIDVQMRHIQAWIIRNIKYTTDEKAWDVNEYWQTAKETLELRTGDCEDMHVLFYVLARKLGISSSRLMLFAGTVKLGAGARTGGHCWLGYRAFNYPINWVFLDTCYYATTATVKHRPKYFVKGQKIHSPHDTNYQNIWFAFNEETSFKALHNKNI